MRIQHARIIEYVVTKIFSHKAVTKMAQRRGLKLLEKGYWHKNKYEPNFDKSPLDKPGFSGIMKE